MTVKNKYKEKSFAVFGLGKAGESAIKLLHSLGVEIYAWDDNEEARSKIDKDHLALQKDIFLTILQATWSNFRTSEQTIDQLIEAGFKEEDIEIHWDDAKMFYTFSATKPSP